MKTPSAMTMYPGEQVVWSGRQAWKSEIMSFVAGIVLMIIGLTLYARGALWPFGLGLGLLIMLGATLRLLTSEYALTNRRVYIKYGLISRAVSDIPVENITDALLIQNFIGRLLDYGHLKVNTASSGGAMTILTGLMRGVADPVGIRAKIDSIREGVRNSRQTNERLQRLDDELLYGRISKPQYDFARAQIVSSPPPPYSQNPGYAQPGAPGFSQQPYTQPGYSPAPGYAPAPGYPQQPQQAQPPTWPQQPGYPPQQQQAPPPAWPQQPGYPQQQPQMQPQPPYPQQPQQQPPPPPPGQPPQWRPPPPP